jgi:GWxTD domain-containing protein
MASSAISKLVVVLTLGVPFLAASAPCNLDQQAANNTSEAARPSTAPNYAAWLKEDVRWIATNEERAAFKRLSTDQERDEFIEQFWLRRDPTPEAFPNEFRQEHYKRMVYVNEHFRGLNIPAWRTDQGRIYIVYGPPEEVVPGDRDGLRIETWHYRQMEDVRKDVYIDFIDRCRCGELVFQRWDVRTETPKPKIKREGTEELKVINVLERSPKIQFKDLDEIVTHKICMNLVPVSVSTNQRKVTYYTVLVAITVKVKDKYVSWLEENGERKRTLNVYGRVTSQKGHIEDIFEGTIQQSPDQAGQDFTYTYNMPLRSGIYRIDVVVRDAAEDRKGTWSGTTNVP